MFNPYHPEPAKITRISWQSEGIKLFRFEFVQKVPGYRFSYKPGQFIELSISGFGEAPFAPCGAPDKDYIELCVRDTGGKLTKKLHSMKKDDKAGIRGPYGNGWPSLAGPNLVQRGSPKNLLITVGGLGLVPLRTLILGKKQFIGQYNQVQIFYGAKNPEVMLFRHEFEKWKNLGADIQLIVDKECTGWKGCVGLVTALFDSVKLVENARAFICGPPIMFKPVIEKLKEKGFDEKDIFLSLERRMHCGLGTCQHCGVGSYYTCKHGPVFTFEQLKNIEGAI